VFALLAQPGRKVHVGLHDLLKQLFTVFVHEGRHAHRHFLDQAAQGPKVHWFPMPRAQNDFRCELLGGPAEAVGVLHIAYVALTQPEVGDLAVAFGVQQHVLWFEVALEHLVLVKIVQDHDDLHGLEFGPFFIQPF